MDEIVEHIVKKARLMPVDIGVGLTSNSVTITKVKVVGGVGLQVEEDGKTLLFPWAAMETAVNCFLSAVHNAPNIEFKERLNPVLRHINGMVLHEFEWNSHKGRLRAAELVVRILKEPPFCADTPGVPKASARLDVQGLDGWDDKQLRTLRVLDARPSPSQDNDKDDEDDEEDSEDE